MPSLPPDRSKLGLRAIALAARDALGAGERASAAQALAQRGLPIAIARGTIVAGYAPIRSEIDPMPLLERLAADGARLALPVILGSSERALAFRSFSPGDVLAPGPLGTMQPAMNSAELVPDIVLVPLAAFDQAGHRIGYGAGYYDRTIKMLRGLNRAIAIGIAFAVQEIAAVPTLPHDAALDFVLTETNTFDFRSK